MPLPGSTPTCDTVGVLGAVVSIIASLEVTGRNLEKTLEYGKLTEADYVVSVGSSLESPVTVYDIKSNTSRDVLLETFLDEQGGQA